MYLQPYQQYRDTKGVTLTECRYYVGVDVGTSYTKTVMIDGRKTIIGSSIERSGARLKMAIDQAFGTLLKETGTAKEQICCTAATGFGRRNADIADIVKTEISCHARGAHYHFPENCTIIDIGGQDTKIIKVSEAGKLQRFKMNRKCAAGTGSFLEEIALKLDISPDSMNPMAKNSDEQSALGSFCTVFAATEILTRIREGERVEDMVKSAYESTVKRIIEMERLEGSIVMSGGVIAYHDTIADILERQIGQKVTILPQPQSIGALGAALFAEEECER